MGDNPEIDQELLEHLCQLKAVPGRDPQRAANGRVQFLLQAQQIAAQGVSEQGKLRHNLWKDTIQSIFMIKRKEQSPMFGVMTTLLLIFGMVLGGGGVTVAAAQSSLPDQVLYPVKIWSENVRVDLVADPETQFDLALQFAGRRAEEIYRMAEAGKVAPEDVTNQMQDQLEFALQVAANQPPETGVQLLERARDCLHQQDQLMQQFETQASPNTQAALQRVRQMIQERLNWVEDGLVNPTRLHDHLRLKDGTGQNTPEVTPDETLPAQGTPAPAGENGNTLTDKTPVSGTHVIPKKTLRPDSSDGHHVSGGHNGNCPDGNCSSGDHHDNDSDDHHDSGDHH